MNDLVWISLVSIYHYTDWQELKYALYYSQKLECVPMQAASVDQMMGANKENLGRCMYEKFTLLTLC